jgi:3-hydroxybutyryl-CoA dehydratase
VIDVEKSNNKIIVKVEALDGDNDVVVAGEVKVIPPIVENRLISGAMENF